MNTKHDAIVLLGFSGAGKDTCFRELDKRYPGTYANAKFSSLHKLIVAKVFDLDISQLEDKSVRCTAVDDWCNLSPLDLLTVLYRGITPQMRQAYCAHVLNTIDGKLPVFTDIRSYDEASFVNLVYSRPLFVHLTSNSVSEGTNDYLIEAVAKLSSASNLCRDGLTVEQTVDRLMEIANGN